MSKTWNKKYQYFQNKKCIFKGPVILTRVHAFLCFDGLWTGLSFIYWWLGIISREMKLCSNLNYRGRHTLLAYWLWWSLTFPLGPPRGCYCTSLHFNRRTTVVSGICFLCSMNKKTPQSTVSAAQHRVQRLSSEESKQVLNEKGLKIILCVDSPSQFSSWCQ